MKNRAEQLISTRLESKFGGTPCTMHETINRGGVMSEKAERLIDGCINLTEAAVGTRYKDSESGDTFKLVVKGKKFYLKVLTGDQKGDMIGPASSPEELGVKDMKKIK